MLDACAELLDEGGYDALSTTRVAERAGVAIGSVYQFFPDKRALSQALTRRNLELFVTRIGRRFITDDYSGWWEAVDAIIDEYVDLHRTVPGFRSLHFGDVVGLDVPESVADNNTVISGRLRALLLEEFGLLDSEDVDRAILVAAEAGDAVLKLAFRHDPSGAPEIVAEARQLVRGYLSRQLRSAQPE
ncbi:TetR family transcriptional regulator [Planotetraspora phitsanulokensis]|uniref:TetR family transcriptional regulator n=1 Tax=Planotetraspora phitsanulokensis TaxID=575192 RepID=A0A8J3U6I3_9ACTN|nr:TetR/AcrR family transcriptional regulator [Planotetraspora phitsanulokensis]GII38041.1 TetR family transcriptional regulator [Planotetraspora phitsanulokensis]